MVFNHAYVLFPGPKYFLKIGFFGKTSEVLLIRIFLVTDFYLGKNLFNRKAP
jgi:hypothetical protein